MNERRGTFAAGIVLLVLAFLLLTRCGGGDTTSKVGAVRNGQGPAEPGPVSTRSVTTAPADPAPEPDADAEREAAPDPAARPDPEPADQGSGTVTVDGESLFPLSRAEGVRGGDLTRLRGGRVVARE